jgi:hypothetical protein
VKKVGRKSPAVPVMVESANKGGWEGMNAEKADQLASMSGASTGRPTCIA